MSSEDLIKAPDFTLKNHEDADIKLSDFKGKKVVLYFYPKDNTPGCTTEACAFRDIHEELISKKAVVLGVSPDSTKSHLKFRDKHELPFHLLSDPEHAVAELYEAWGEKQMYGKTYMGIIRSTFIINEKGIITKAFRKVRVKNHAKDVLEALE